ncbi:MAG: phosphoribosylformylglycinamidine synthase, partial [Bacteroidota bacterium]
MIYFFSASTEKVYALQASQDLSDSTLEKLKWLFGNAQQIESKSIEGTFIGPRASMITPWSTNAVEITQNMDIQGISRIESYLKVSEDATFDPMLSQKYNGLNQTIFDINVEPESIIHIEDIAAYNEKEGLALNEEEIEYLHKVAQRLGRNLTDSEVFGFSQVNSEHCRHKIFNGTFIIDGEEKEESLFQMIKKTSKVHPNHIVSAYKDNVAFIEGPEVEQFAPKKADEPSYYKTGKFNSVISLKAETHNFPTTVEPFNGAATGSGGEIRDRLAGGRGSIPLAGTAVYMTSYSRLKDNRPWEKAMDERPWLYQKPIDILIKASNGASDFGNKFGQPLICGSLLTFEHAEEARKLGFDKVIMLAGGIGYGKAEQATKDLPSKGDKIVILGGDNYRIGMGGAAVSSADTGAFASGIELNAVQRSNPEMQKRAANTIRALVENDINPIVSIHDHGAGGHLNCLSELVEETGGVINIDDLPIGDPTLSFKEILGNESQERMGLVVAEKDIAFLKKVADRERSPMYNVGDVREDLRFTFESKSKNAKPLDLQLSDMFGSSPKTIMKDTNIERSYQSLQYDAANLKTYIEQVLKLEAVACKDWLTNKVDRCVGGKVAIQQCTGPLQLPLNNCAVMAFDYDSYHGIATSIGHAPVSTLINPTSGVRNAITEALTNLIWAPLNGGLDAVSLSANWMWPCRNKGEDARLYEAVKGVSDFAIELGINVPTGKDSLSMSQKYKDETVVAPGTVVISAAAHCDDFSKVVEPFFKAYGESIYYINFSNDAFQLGGSSFGQIQNRIGTITPGVKSAKLVKSYFNTIQDAIRANLIVAGHDISAGGMITTLLELCFSTEGLGAKLNFSNLNENDIIKICFAENTGIIIQSKSDNALESFLKDKEVAFTKLGEVTSNNNLEISHQEDVYTFNIAELRDHWYETSYLLDQHQSGEILAKARFENYKNQALHFNFPKDFNGQLKIENDERPKAAIIREKGSNSEREMANAMYQAGFDVKDVHMTDL